MAVFKTEAYRAQHGHNPAGIKDWAFVPADYVWPGLVPEDGIVWVWGIFGDAKREAIRQYPEISEWEVMP